jgi:hypothetical protein
VRDPVALEFLDEMMLQRETRESKGWAAVPVLEEVIDARGKNDVHRRNHEMRTYQTDVVDDADNAADAQAAMQKANREIGGTRQLAPPVKKKDDAEEEQTDSAENAQAEMRKANRAASRSKAAK